MSTYEITEAMIIYGGGFVAGLGRLIRQADADNQQRLIAAFPEYWENYTELARLRQERDRQQPEAQNPL